MKIKVDQLKCDTSGLCVKRYPEIFNFQEGSKKAEAIAEEIPLYLEPKYLDIVAICPSRAISIEK